MINAMSIKRDLEKIYQNLVPPITTFTTFVGFSVSIIGELEQYSSPMASFVNITGYTFIGLMSGLFWPVAMPLLSLGVIYNKKMLSSSS